VSPPTGIRERRAWCGSRIDDHARWESRFEARRNAPARARCATYGRACPGDQTWKSAFDQAWHVQEASRARARTRLGVLQHDGCIALRPSPALDRPGLALEIVPPVTGPHAQDNKAWVFATEELQVDSPAPPSGKRDLDDPPLSPSRHATVCSGAPRRYGKKNIGVCGAKNALAHSRDHMSGIRMLTDATSAIASTFLNSNRSRPTIMAGFPCVGQTIGGIRRQDSHDRVSPIAASAGSHAGTVASVVQ